MPANYSHDKLTTFSIFFLLAFATQLSCTRNESQSISGLPHTPIAASAKAININTADVTELQKIPGVGPASAKKIIEHRKLYGPFRRPEEILIVDGISEKRFREFRSYISIE
ncbi:MAG: hypothetical protein DMF63_07830 [Acidobacteria bacterium]|nr:MAG: hypothetical protein DMF63_07830 [Acidobacteriota bacterium]